MPWAEEMTPATILLFLMGSGGQSWAGSEKMAPVTVRIVSRPSVLPEVPFP